MARLLFGLLAVHIAGVTAQVTSSEIRPFNDAGELLVQLTGRYEPASDAQTVNFDAPAFEIAFSVTNTSSVEIVLMHQTGSLITIQDTPTPGDTGVGAATNVRRLASVASAPECVDTGFEAHTFTVYVNGVAQGPVHNPESSSSCVLCTFDTGMAVPGAEFTYPLASGMDEGGTYEIRIVKDSEADFNNCLTIYPNFVTFSMLRLFGSGAALQLPKKANYPRPKIEFIGDSKMTGMCNLCHDGGDPSTVFGSSVLFSWPKQMCDKLDADCRMSTWSGMGLTGGPTTQMDLWRDKQVMTLDQSSHAAAQDGWVADVVMINLAIDDDFTPDEFDNFWGGVETTLTNFMVEVRAAYSFNTVVMLTCMPTFPTSANTFCRKAKEAVRKAKEEQDDDHKVWHAVVWKANEFLSAENQCCGLPDKVAGTQIADAAIAACNAERPHTCVHSRAPPGPPGPSPPPPPQSWDKRNPPVVSFLFIGFGVLLLCICAIYVGGFPDVPCQKKVDPEAAAAPL